MHHPVSEYASYKAEDRFVAEQILARDFDIDERPPGKPNPEDPVKVTVSLYVMELGVCARNQELTVGGYFRQSWNDPRLAYNFGDMVRNSGQKLPVSFTVIFFSNIFFSFSVKLA